MKVYRPVPPEVTVATIDLAAVARGITSVGIVDDSMDPPLIDGIVDRLKVLLPQASVRVWVKPTGTAPAPDALIAEMAREVQVAVAGVGM